MTAAVVAVVPAQLARRAAPGETAEAVVLHSLVVRAQRGDEDAFAELYTRYRATVHRYLVRRIGNHHTAEELAQDVFVRAFNRLPTYEWRGVAFGAWLLTIARNLSADYWKGARTRLEVQVADFAALPNIDPESGHGLPEPETLAYLAGHAVMTCLAELRERNAEQYQVLVCRYLDNLSVAATARLMCKQEGAIKALTYRATRALARIVSDLPDGAL